MHWSEVLTTRFADGKPPEPQRIANVGTLAFATVVRGPDTLSMLPLTAPSLEISIPI